MKRDNKMKLTKTKLKEMIREELLSEKMHGWAPNWQKSQLEDVLWKAYSEFKRFTKDASESIWAKDSKLKSSIKQAEKSIDKLQNIIEKLPINKEEEKK